MNSKARTDFFGGIFPKKYIVEWNNILKFMFDFCSMIIKVLFLCKNSLRTLSILESLSYSFDIQTDLFKVFMVSWSWLFSSLQLLTALTLPNTHSSNPLHMKPAVPQPHSHRLYEILPPFSVIFAIILCNHFPLYS